MVLISEQLTIVRIMGYKQFVPTVKKGGIIDIETSDEEEMNAVEEMNEVEEMNAVEEDVVVADQVENVMILYGIVLYCIILYYAVIYCNILQCTVLYSTGGGEEEVVGVGLVDYTITLHQICIVRDGKTGEKTRNAIVKTTFYYYK